MQTLSSDVLIIGGGLAGLCAALEARRAGRSVTLICKAKPGRSGNTVLAACNMAINPAATPFDEQLLARDLLAGGMGIGDPALIGTLAAAAAEVVPFLEEQGVELLQDGSGHLLRTIPGHSAPRTVCTRRTALPEQTAGLSLTLPLLDRAAGEGVRMLGGLAAVSLLKHQGRVAGALALDRTNRPLRFQAGATVLACGGGGRIYARSNNARGMTADGLCLAYRAGAELRDLEFVQFHPAMGLAPVRIILPTTLFGDGAVLRNSRGERFLLRSVEGGEAVATRDQMSRAIHAELAAGLGVGGGVHLDLSAVPPELVETRYRALWELLGRRGGAPQRHPPTVGLAVHFFMGGVTIDVRGQTTLEGLFAAGEVTGGVHGANRLGGCALTEAVAFGRIAGANAARTSTGPPRGASAPSSLPLPDNGGDAAAGVAREVQRLLWDGAGVIRSEKGLSEALQRWWGIRRRFEKLAQGDGSWCEARNVLTASRLLLESALARRESRGAHWREDFPRQDDREWLGSLRVCRGEDKEPELRFVRATTR